MQPEPLVKGGQGRSDEEVEDSATICAWVFLAGIALIGIALLARWIA
jgi:hypothetical protein